MTEAAATSKNTIIVRMAKHDDMKVAKEIHGFPLFFYDPLEGGWTTEAHLISDERVSLKQLKDALLDKINPILLAFDTETNKPVGTLQLDPAEYYPDFGEYTAEGYYCSYEDPLPKKQQIFIGLFSVDPLYQSRGVGRMLVDEALRYSKENLGRKQAVVYVIKQRPELVTWYKRLGFADYGERVPFPDQNLMKKEDIHFQVLRLDL
ncbi:hypothetical protein BGZ83_011971 [Gryganskiella cystojenkinii]|nr:hypothetical protein BGZ83_011971 [Gryganskiella cystojenkinii]